MLLHVFVRPPAVETRNCTTALFSLQFWLVSRNLCIIKLLTSGGSLKVRISVSSAFHPEEINPADAEIMPFASIARFERDLIHERVRSRLANG